MITQLLERVFGDCFGHLGIEAQYQLRAGVEEGERITVTAIIKEPENAYEIGSSELIGQVAEITIPQGSIPRPKIGDYFFLKDRRYKVFEEPIFDSSNLVYKTLAVLDNRLLSKQNICGDFEGRTQRRTAVYCDVHEDSSSGSDVQNNAKMQFPKESNVEVKNATTSSEKRNRCHY